MNAGLVGILTACSVENALQGIVQYVACGKESSKKAIKGDSMTIEEIKSMLDGESYDFLRTNEHLQDRVILLTLGGSYTYGTNTEQSDVDIRGCALNRPVDILGLSTFEQIVDTATDTTIYSFNKLI